MDEVFGYIERLTFQNDENGFAVAHLKEAGRRDLICLVGVMPSLKAGETIRCFGRWKQHLVHGKQFEVQEMKREAPADLIGIEKYLGSGLIKGIGPAYAKRIVDRFGTATLDVIDKDPGRLTEVGGIGHKRIDKIQECWAAQKSIREVMIFLQSYGVSPTYAQKIFKAYGPQSIQKVKDNPFHLAKDIFGIGFKTADTIAQKMGIAKDASQRIDAGIEYVLSKLSDDGHVCHPVEEFLPVANTILEVDPQLVDNRLALLKKEGRIVLADLEYEGTASRPFIWLKALHACEVGISKEIERLQRSDSLLRNIDAQKAIEWVQERLRIRLAPNQQLAVAAALREKLQIITGGPGTGKSTITNAILALSSKLTSKILLAAPTGRAAKRMSEITRRKAFTIHSLLEFDFTKAGFKRNRDNPLDCDLIIIDEASMIDTQLMYSLLKAIPSHARAIFVGDINQLPSVGPGNVLKDMIASERIGVSLLNEIFRQARGSRIITNAHRINQGEFPNLHTRANSDFFFLEANEPEQVLDTILGLVSTRLPKKYGFDPIDQIQVLAPMRKGAIGTGTLNTVLQERLNPGKVLLSRGGVSYKEGDKVMQIRNNYQKEVFNGDVGRITKIDLNEQQLFVDCDGRLVEYDFDDLDELVLAYAVSVHKYQGSECPCIVMPVHTSHFKLLHRNLLYTGVTRGKKLVVLVGSKKALAIAVGNDEVKRRYSSLREQLRGLAIVGKS
jgi:exodeoxyribonuclease V alpha subunit